jgi:hypothetical protein
MRNPGVILVGIALAAAACGGSGAAGPATTTASPVAVVTTQPSPTTPSTTAPPVSTTETPEPSVTTLPPTTSPTTTSTLPHPLEGAILDTVWEEEPSYVQQYYLDGEPTGLFSAMRLPVEWNDEGSEVQLWLGFAERSGTGDRGVYTPGIDATVLVLELAGYHGTWERFRVADAVDVSIPAGSGTLGSTCFEEGYVRHASLLAFTATGPEIARLWRIDPTSHALVEIAPGAAACPDLNAGPVADTATGRIVTTAGGCAFDTDVCGHVVDLSSTTPQFMPWWEHAGSVLDSWGYVSRHAVAVVGGSQDAAAPQERQAWLEAFLAWDLGGHAVWHVLDEVALPDTGVAETLCWDATGAPAMGLMTPNDEPGTVSVAWRIDLDTERFIPADADEIRCEVAGD